MMEKKKMSTWKKILIGCGAVFFIAGFAGLLDDKDKPKATKPAEEKQSTTKPAEKKQPGVGETLKTKYFDVTLNSAQISDHVNTGNQFADLPREEGNHYLVLNTTFKNTDSESRTILDGKVMIDYNSKRYDFDKSETIMLDGWGLFLDKINPLTSKTTNLVYKIPTEIRGKAWYQPGRSGKNDLIFIGSIE